MQTNILWEGIEYYSLENCLIKTTTKGTAIRSSIVGKYQDNIYRVEYQIRTNADWETIFFEIEAQHSKNINQHIRGEGDGKGNWVLDTHQSSAFKGCIDIDIPLTPFTNSLPINRLRLKDGEERQINVIYLDLLEQNIIPVRQKYIRLDNKRYHYENIPNDFEANITIDESGFVIDYPELFERVALLRTDYHEK